MEYKQTYRNRGQAYREFVKPQGLPVSERKFYDDAAAFMAPDKSLALTDLLAYARAELKVDAVRGEALKGAGPAEAEREKRLAEIELERAELDLEKQKKAARKDDDRWMETDVAISQKVAFAAHLEDSLQQRTELRLPHLVSSCGGDPGRSAELANELELLYAEAFTVAVRLSTQDVTFGDEPAADEDGAAVQ